MKNTNLIYDVHEKPPFWNNIAFALQQLLSIIAATMLVPLLADASGVYLSQSAALIGAGVGTIVYLLFTKFKSPVFLGSSFAFVNPLITAVAFGYLGILMGSLFAGLVYLVIAFIIRFVGSNWINKIMPPIIIGPTVALIGFDLATSAINNVMNVSQSDANYSLVSILMGLITFFIVIVVSVRGPKRLKMFPFIVGILGGYVLCVLLTLIGNASGVTALQLVDFTPYTKIGDFSNWLPNITLVGVIKEGATFITSFGDVVTIFVAFVPIALVSFAEHIADHKNISSIIGKDLFKTPGLHRTLMGDGLGSVVGAMFGGVPNTTYGESIGCVALSRNASTWTIFTAAIMCVVLAFFYPAIAFFESIPTCVIGGVSIALYGFISVSGLKMINKIDLDDSRNLFVISAIFICGIGGLVFNFGSVKITNIAAALIVGIIANALLTITFKRKKKKEEKIEEKPVEEAQVQPAEQETKEPEKVEEKPKKSKKKKEE